MTDKRIDVKTYNCVYCNKTLTKFETQPLYKEGKFLTTCEECWYKHAKEEGYVVSDVQTINTTIDDLINGNLRDMEITAQFGVYRQAVKGLDEQLKAYKMEAEEGREINAELKAENEKLKVWKSITPLKTKMLVKALTEIKEIAEKQYHTKLVDKDCINCDESFAQILQKCEVLKQ